MIENHSGCRWEDHRQCCLCREPASPASWARSRAARGCARSCTSASSCSTASASSSGTGKAPRREPDGGEGVFPPRPSSVWGRDYEVAVPWPVLLPLLSLQRTFIERFLNRWNGAWGSASSVGLGEGQPGSGRTGVGVGPRPTARPEGRSALSAPPQKGSFLRL